MQRLLAITCMLAGALPANGAADPPRIAECRIGFNGYFKVGSWTPVAVAVAGDVAGRQLRVAVTTMDSDGVLVSNTAKLETGGESVDGLWPVRLYTNVGRIGARVDVRLLAEDDAVLDRYELFLIAGRENASAFAPLSATSELIVQFGASPVGLEDAVRHQDTGGRDAPRAFVRLLDVDALPTDWFGYEAVDLLVLTNGDEKMMRRLAGDRRRHEALLKWLGMGGRIVVLWGGESAQGWLSEGGPLSVLTPGRLAGVVRLPETGPLEHFAGSAVSPAPSGVRAAIMVPQLAEVEGRIDVYAGRQPSDLPLVVRTALGLGEVAFVGADVGKPPLSEWVGRKAFLQAVLRPYLAERDDREEAQSLVARGYNDLSGALRQRLGRSFQGVAPISFSLVAMIAVAYLLALGPIDYLLVHRWLRRPWVAWVSFPLMVLAFGLAAMAIADWRTAGGGARVNQLELVDIDTISGQARGTFWATLYSQRSKKYDLAVDVQSLNGRVPQDADVLLTWWGLPGVGVGGMHSGASNLDIVRSGYRYGTGLSSLVGVPVLTSSTKSVLARWTAPVPGVIDAQLDDADGLANGFIENRSGMSLRNLRLLYNGWAYRLGNLESGQRIEVDDEISPRRVKTIVTQQAVGPSSPGQPGQPGQAEGEAFVAQRVWAEQILNLMMFYEAAGGIAFASLMNEYQAYCDLSRQLELGRAILMAEAPSGGSRLINAASREVIGNEGAPANVIYRFVLPVNKQ